MKKLRLVLAGMAFVLAITFILHAQQTVSSAQTSTDDLNTMLQAVEATAPLPATAAPNAGNFYSAQHSPSSEEPWPPLPADILGLPIWPLGGGWFLLDDENVNYAALAQQRMAKPVAIFAGDSLAYVPDASVLYANPLVQEQLPVADWGTQALALSFAGQMNGDTYRILAANNNTVVFTNGVVAGTNQAGQFLDVLIDGPVEFQASQPIQVAQFANGATLSGYGDPCEILLPPTGHYLVTNTVVILPNDGVTGDFDKNYLNIIVAQSAITNTMVDGLIVTATNFVTIGTSGYYGAQLTVTNSGTHTVTSSQPVGVEVYGFGFDDAYGYFGSIVK
jgi:hypothetical protein